MIERMILLVILTILSGTTAYAMGVLVHKPSREATDVLDTESPAEDDTAPGGL